MKVLIVFGLIGLLMLAGMFSLASVSQSYATAQQAQAAIEASRATQAVAVSNLILTVILGLVVLAALVVVAVVALRLRAAQAGWKGGPNALWVKRGESQPQTVDPQTLLLTALAYRLLDGQHGGGMPVQQLPRAEPAALPDEAEDWSQIWEKL